MLFKVTAKAFCMQSLKVNYIFVCARARACVRFSTFANDQNDWKIRDAQFSSDAFPHI